MIAKVAVSAANYSFDKPFDYFVPSAIESAVVPGVRVKVPFSRSNRPAYGIVLATEFGNGNESCKAIEAVLDEKPVLSALQLRLGLFMHERYFCTCFDAYHCMLPAGLWYDSSGKRKTNDKFETYASLAVSAEEAFHYAAEHHSAAKQNRIIELLAGYELLSLSELLHVSEASRAALNRLVQLNIVQLTQKEVFRRPKISHADAISFPKLNEEQSRVYAGLSQLAETGDYSCSLLYGITGSGKTSVYIHLIKKQLELGKSAILLVPEIALTPQMISVFMGLFGQGVAVLHSSLSVGEKYDEWKRISSGEAQIVIGTRSAVFAPVSNLGILIIDEEQESSYRSENAPRYDAREIARYLCSKHKCPLVLGSATPDLRSMYNAEKGSYHLFRLENRYNQHSIPKVHISDMRKELINGNGNNIGRELKAEIEKNLENREQTILFLNRRGTNKLVACKKCGFTYRCPRCSVSLTYHGNTRLLRCHYCGYSAAVSRFCPECSNELSFIGSGTQNVVSELEELFPGIEIMRADADSVHLAGGHDELFHDFVQRNVPILVGTQMVSKGLNFENVTLVGIIDADQNLFSGNFRSGEETFSMITQVIGRSGRAQKPGRAVIQTFVPDNQIINYAAKQDYSGFYSSEIQMRQIQNAPPFKDILVLTVSGRDENKVIHTAEEIAAEFAGLFANQQSSSVFGPIPHTISKMNNTFRYQINLITNLNKDIRRLVAFKLCEYGKKYRNVSVFAEAE